MFIFRPSGYPPLLAGSIALQHALQRIFTNMCNGQGEGRGIRKNLLNRRKTEFVATKEGNIYMWLESQGQSCWTGETWTRSMQVCGLCTGGKHGVYSSEKTRFLVREKKPNCMRKSVRNRGCLKALRRIEKEEEKLVRKKPGTSGKEKTGPAAVVRSHSLRRTAPSGDFIHGRRG